jgi:cell filamentation protein
MSDRYETEGYEESQFEPDSGGTVLKNRLGITSLAEMQQAETMALLRTTEAMADSFDQDHRFTAQDLCAMHRHWLGGIYSWAGKYRNVMMSKGGFPFASPAFIPQLMTAFEKEHLAVHTPCHGDDEAVATSLAIVHVEIVLIHPFREGNGRLSRLLAMLMGLQADLPILVFDEMEGKRRERYFAAVRAGMGGDYAPMKDIFMRIIAQSRQEQ